jgi:activating signal cointegrator complex subunit 1
LQSDWLIRARAVGTTESLNAWRSTTLSILRKDATQKLSSETAAIAELVVDEFNQIMSDIGDIPPTEARDQSLRNLVNNSIELSRLLRVQKAKFTVLMPSIEGHQVTVFDRESMEDIGGEDEESLEGREVRCVAFLGIVKSGDENGERVHLKNIVAKMRVLCAPD